MAHHHHQHGTSCGCRPQAPLEPQDAAGKSLTSALRTSFGILKIIMVVLVILFLFSGMFYVNENEQAMVLLFGRVQGEGDARILKPGLHFSLPEPMSEIIRMPVKEVQSLPIESFWYFQTEQEKVQEASGQPWMYFQNNLDPLKDGYCLTRNDSIQGLEGMDYNIVHSKWTVMYYIDSPEKFFENIFYEPPRPGEDFLDAANKTVKPLLESLASDAIVATLVKYNIDDAVTSKADIAVDVKNRLQEKLDAIGSGIQLDSVRADRIIWPRQVDDAYQASNRASQQSEQAKITARSAKEKMLTDTGGSQAEAVLEKIKRGGLTQAQKEEQVALLKGQVQTRISEARAYRTKIVEEAKANAEYLQKLLPEYRKHPELVLQRLYQDAIEQVLLAVDEKIFVTPDAGAEGSRELRVQVNRDPKIKRKETPGSSSPGQK